MNTSNETFSDLAYMIISVHEEALDQYKNFKEEGLSIGMIEAEGYLRCAKTLYNYLEDNYPNILGK